MKNNINTSHESLYRDEIGRCLAIQQILNKHDQLITDLPPEEWHDLRQRFWNEYVYPQYEPVYFELFPDDRSKKENPDKFKGDFDILNDNKKMVVALCEWLKREGCFHFFESYVFFIDPTPSDLAFLLSDGVPFRRYPPQYVGKLLERVALDCIDDRKKIDKLTNWVIGLALISCIMALLFISMMLK